MPKVSVLIPTYNMAHFLDESIQSVLDQTLEDFELIIVDNASTDNTKEIVKKYLDDARVHYFRNDSNVGMTRNWNKCLLKAKGTYIKFLNADDRLHKSNLAEMSLILDKQKNISVVSSWKELFGDSSSISRPKESGDIEGKKAITLSLSGGNWIGEPTVIMFRRKNLYLGLFNINYHWLPDWEMWLRHLTIGDLYVIPLPLSHIRLHKGQMTNIVSQNFMSIFEEYYYAREVYDFHPFKIADESYDKHLRKTIVKIINNIPSMLYNPNKKALKNAIKIIYREGYIIYAVLKTIRYAARMIFKRSYKLFSEGK